MKPDSNQKQEQTVVLLDDSLRATGGFTQIPNSVLRHPTLSMGAKVAYSVLLSYAWQDRFCHPAQESLARDCGISDRQVRRLLTELKLGGSISWKQLGLNRPNRYFILPITDWIKPESLPDQGRTNMSAPDRTDMSVQGRTPASGQDGTRMSDYKDPKKNTQTTHTRMRVPSASLNEKKTLTLIDRFHAENGRALEGRKPKSRELAFAAELISEHGFEKAAHVITFGIAKAKETGFAAQYFQAYEGYVPDALRDFDKEAKLATARDALATKEAEERQKEIDRDRAHFARPLEERVKQSLRGWVQITEKMKHRKLSPEEIEKKRIWYREMELASEQRFVEEFGQVAQERTA